MSEQPDDPVLHITAQYLCELQAGKQPCLSDYLARYPQYAEEITDFVAYYHLAESRTPDELTPAPSLSETSRSILKSFQAGECSAPPGTLLTGPHHRHLTVSQIARQMHLSSDIILLLEHRSIDPTTIPTEVITRLAAVSGSSPRDIQLYLASTALRRQDISHSKHLRVAESGRYHMSAANHHRLPSFKQVVEASHLLPAEQKAFWLTLSEEKDS
jgi:hypothetical protein